MVGRSVTSYFFVLLEATNAVYTALFLVSLGCDNPVANLLHVLIVLPGRTVDGLTNGNPLIASLLID